MKTLTVRKYGSFLQILGMLISFQFYSGLLKRCRKEKYQKNVINEKFYSYNHFKNMCCHLFDFFNKFNKLYK